MNSMNDIVKYNYKFDGKVLTDAIKEISRNNDIAKMKVRLIIKTELGVHKQTLSLWEKSKSTPRISDLIWLKEFFGLKSVEIFFKREV